MNGGIGKRDKQTPLFVTCLQKPKNRRLSEFINYVFVGSTPTSSPVMAIARLHINQNKHWLFNKN